MKNKRPRSKLIKRIFTKKQKVALLIAVILLAVFLGGCAALTDGLPVDEEGGVVNGLLGTRSQSVNILLLLTVLSLLPSILIMLTSFTRIIIVLSLVRNGMGLQQMPPNQVLVGLALFLTLFVMSPVVNDIGDNAYTPYINGEITADEAVDAAMDPLRDFMLRQTYTKDLNFFVGAAQTDDGEPLVIEEYDDIPTRVLIPAFITSEIKRGFEIGFFIYVPFIVIDMIVASTLMSMGMMMLPPTVISLPFKLLIFVLVDGWLLTMQSLLASFNFG